MSPCKMCFEPTFSTRKAVPSTQLRALDNSRRIPGAICHRSRVFGCNTTRITRTRVLSQNGTCDNPAQHVHWCSGIYNKFSFLRFYYGWRCKRRHHSLVSDKKVALSFALSLKICLANLHASPRAHLSFSFFLRPIHKFQSVRTAPMRNFDLNSSERRTFSFSDVCLTQRSSRESYSSELVPTLLCPSWKSLHILAAQCPVIHNPTVVHLSYNCCVFVTIRSRLFCGVVPQPACVQTRTYRRNYNPIQTYRMTFGRTPLVTKRCGANTFQEVFARLSIEHPRWTPAPEVLFPRRTCTSLCLQLRGWSGFWCRFCTLIPRRAENYNAARLLSTESILLVLFRHIL